MKQIVLFLLLFAAAKTSLHAQTINVVNNTSFMVALYISYSTVPGTCATNKTTLFIVPATSNTIYNVNTLTWSGATPPAGGAFTAVAYSADLWFPAHNINPNPCGNSPRYNDGAVGDPGYCSWLTPNDCFITDPSNPGFFPPNTAVSANFSSGPNAVVTIN